ncbi:MAG: family 2 glycosyl transferase [Mucilaginibacter sp.]|nr:family 2 glycosyl transferase [Mucilaginibacter sp.]
MSTVSLCIPAYNAALYLPRLLSSAANQLIPFDEILVYDDCSTDNTIEVAKKFGAKVIQGRVNKGCSFGKNRLADATLTDWIHFHDADDDLLPDFTTLVHKWIKDPCCPDIVLFNYEYRDYQTNELISIKKFNRDALQSDPLRYAITDQINPFCGLYKKQSFLRAGGYDIDPMVLFNEDTAFHIKMAIAKLKFDSEDKISIINYRINSSMSVTNNRKCLVAQYYVLKKTADTTGMCYAREISLKLWSITGPLAAVKDWKYVKKVIVLCAKLGYSHPQHGSGIFKTLIHINPFWAVRLREVAIRLLKPRLRAGE